MFTFIQYFKMFRQKWRPQFRAISFSFPLFSYFHSILPLVFLISISAFCHCHRFWEWRRNNLIPYAKICGSSWLRQHLCTLFTTENVQRVLHTKLNLNGKEGAKWKRKRFYSLLISYSVELNVDEDVDKDRDRWMYSSIHASWNRKLS